MAVKAKVQEALDIGGVSYATVLSLSDSSSLIIDDTVADGQTDYLIAAVLDVTAITALLIVSDQDVTLEVNDSAIGVPTIALLANVPYLWHNQHYANNLLTANVTQLFVTNASGSIANFKFIALYDATP